MAVETVINGPTSVVPRPDGGRNIVVVAGPNHAYVIPLPPQGAVELAEALTMDDEQLKAQAQRQQAAASLIVPNGPTAVPK